MGIGKALSNLKLLDKLKKANPGELLNLYENELTKAKEGIVRVENTLEKARESGNVIEIKKLEKKLDKMKRLTNLVEGGITESITGGASKFKVPEDEE